MASGGEAHEALLAHAFLARSRRPRASRSRAADDDVELVSGVAFAEQDFPAAYSRRSSSARNCFRSSP